MIRALVRSFLLAFAPVFLGACSDTADVLPQQRDKIVSFLTGSHTPRLVAEADADLDGSTPFYTVSGDAAYRYISNYYDPERINRPEVSLFSTVRITFRLYVFTSYASISDTRLPEYSNDPLFEAAYIKNGLDLTEWSFEPLTIDMRSSDILKGLRSALVGCRESDEVEVYMTYNMAYGDEYFDIIPKQSPIAVFFTVNSVE